MEDIRGDASNTSSASTISRIDGTLSPEENSDILLSNKNNTFENNWFPLAKWVYRKYKNRHESEINIRDDSSEVERSCESIMLSGDKDSS